MKKRNLLFLLAAFLLIGFSSCNKEDALDSQGPEATNEVMLINGREVDWSFYEPKLGKDGVEELKGLFAKPETRAPGVGFNVVVRPARDLLAVGGETVTATFGGEWTGEITTRIVTYPDYIPVTENVVLTGYPSSYIATFEVEAWSSATPGDYRILLVQYSFDGGYEYSPADIKHQYAMAGEFWDDLDKQGYEIATEGGVIEVTRSQYSTDVVFRVRDLNAEYDESDPTDLSDIIVQENFSSDEDEIFIRIPGNPKDNDISFVLEYAPGKISSDPSEYPERGSFIALSNGIQKGGITLSVSGAYVVEWDAVNSEWVAAKNWIKPEGGSHHILFTDVESTDANRTKFRVSATPYQYTGGSKLPVWSEAEILSDGTAIAEFIFPAASGGSNPSAPDAGWLPGYEDNLTLGIDGAGRWILHYYKFDDPNDPESEDGQADLDVILRQHAWWISVSNNDYVFGAAGGYWVFMIGGEWPLDGTVAFRASRAYVDEDGNNQVDYLPIVDEDDNTLGTVWKPGEEYFTYYSGNYVNSVSFKVPMYENPTASRYWAIEYSYKEDPDAEDGLDWKTWLRDADQTQHWGGSYRIQQTRY